jgi:deazaflavin-dependent oxidoreductase (nitroreductase family)
MDAPPSEALLRDLAGEEYCYLTTTGRRTGSPHEIEIWYALVPETGTLYMLSGGRDRSDWVKNLRKTPEVSARISSHTLRGRARETKDPEEDALARRLLVEKYERSPGSLADWGRTALPVAVDLSSLR